VLLANPTPVRFSEATFPREVSELGTGRNAPGIPAWLRSIEFLVELQSEGTSGELSWYVLAFHLLALARKRPDPPTRREGKRIAVNSRRRPCRLDVRRRSLS